jgi:DNA-binding HxlR family transcriptional regulator
MSRMKNRSPRGQELLTSFCPLFHSAVELIGKRWTGAVIRLLLGGPKRFNEIAAGVPGISDRLLAERLRELEMRGIVARNVDGASPVRVNYELTESGAELDATIRALGSWAERWMKQSRA